MFKFMKGILLIFIIIISGGLSRKVFANQNENPKETISSKNK